MKKQCDWCSKMFNNKSNLNRHVKLHEDPPKFECFKNPQYCEKIFQTKVSLQRHVKICGDLNPADHRYGKVKVKRVEPQAIQKYPSLHLTIPRYPGPGLIPSYPRRGLIDNQESTSGGERLSLNLSTSDSENEDPMNEEPIKHSSVRIDDEVEENTVVRRSGRKSPSELFKELIFNLNKSDDKNLGLKIKNIKKKGHGIVTTRNRKCGEFVVEYAGLLITNEDAIVQEEEYSQDSSIGCYMFFFEHLKKKYCVDATLETERMGRLLNHSRKNPNLITKVIN